VSAERQTSVSLDFCMVSLFSSVHVTEWVLFTLHTENQVYDTVAYICISNYYIIIIELGSKNGNVQ